MTRAFHISKLVVILALVLATRARADDRDPAAAEVLFDAGRAALERGDFGEACAKFEESQRLDPGAGTLLNIGTCSENLGRLAVAWQSYTEASRILPASDPREEYLKQHLQAVSARVPWLTIRLAPGTPADASVTRDGVRVGAGSLGVAIPVDPGKVRLEVRAEGREVKRQTVELAEGEKKEIQLEAGAPLPPVPKPAPIAARPRAAKRAPSQPIEGGGTRTLGYAVGAVGVTGLVVSGVTTVMMLNKKADVESDCDTGTKECNSDKGPDAAKAGKTLSTVSTVAFGVGVLGVGVGTYLVLTSSTSTNSAAVSIGGTF